MDVAHFSKARVKIGQITVPANGCGSKDVPKMAPRQVEVNGNKDQHLRSPSYKILSHTQIRTERDSSSVSKFKASPLGVFGLAQPYPGLPLGRISAYPSLDLNHSRISFCNYPKVYLLSQRTISSQVLLVMRGLLLAPSSLVCLTRPLCPNESGRRVPFFSALSLTFSWFSWPVVGSSSPEIHPLPKTGQRNRCENEVFLGPGPKRQVPCESVGTAWEPRLPSPA